MTVSVRQADRSTAAIGTGMSIPSLRARLVTMAADEPTGMLVKRMGSAVETSPMR